MYAMQVLANIISFIPSCILLYSTFCKNKKSMFELQSVGSVLNLISNLLLGSYSAVVTNTASLVRNILVSKGNMTKRIRLGLCLITFVVGIIVNKIGPVGLLAVIASVLYTLMVTWNDSAQFSRIALVINQCLWFVHHIYIGLYTSAITCIVIGVVTFINILRYKGVENKMEDRKNIAANSKTVSVGTKFNYYGNDCVADRVQYVYSGLYAHLCSH